MRKAETAVQRILLACAIAGLALACGKSGTSAGTGGAVGSGGGGEIGTEATGGTATMPGSGGSVVDDAAATGGSTGNGGRQTGGGGSLQGSGGSAGSSRADASPSASGGVASGGRSGGGGTGTQSSGGIQAGGGATTSARGGAAGSGVGGKTSAAGGASGGGGTSGTSDAKPSAGCGKTPPASGRANITVSGTSREYILKLPDGYDANHPYRLIFGFHGAQYDDNWVADGGAPLTGPFFGLESEAKGSAIFVAPQKASGSGDLAFVDAMVTQFKSQLCIDENRVFAAGFSMGAMMTITIGCSRSDTFRAIAPMSGQIQGSCGSGSHIAYWASHGTNDPTINISNGQAARDEFVKRNHCGTQTSSPDENNCATYQGCDAGYPVVWCTFDGVHEPAPFAGPAIWKFLAPL